MLIYVFTENYPSQYKPYFDTQFEQFLKDGHILKIFSSQAQGRSLAAKVKQLELDKITRHAPSTIRTLPKYLIPILINLIRNPLKRINAAIKISSSNSPYKQRFLQIMRMMVLPLEKPDLCLVHNLVSAIQFTFFRDIYKKCPIAFYYHGGEVAGFTEISYKDSSRGFDAADFVFTNTESSRSHAISRGCNQSKINVCPVGFNLSEFDAEKQRKYKQGNILRLLTIGRMSEEKGHIYSLEAINKLINTGNNNIRYKLIGDGPLHDVLQQYVIENGLEEYVEFMGHVSRETLYSELKNADVHILPSIVLGTWQENQACVVQEAMLFKTLVINSNAGGVPESTAPIMQQYCVEPGNAQMIADCVVRLLDTDEGRLREMGEQCRAFALEKYNIETLNRYMLSVCTQKQ